MAAKGDKIDFFQNYHPEISTFSTKPAKSISPENVSTSSIKPSYYSINDKFYFKDPVTSRNFKYFTSPIQPVSTDKPPMIEVKQPPSLFDFETKRKEYLQMEGVTFSNEDLQKYYSPYLSHIASVDPTGKPYSNPAARMKELIEEMKNWEADDISNSDGQKSAQLTNKIELETKQDIDKIKVECPLCKEIRYVNKIEVETKQDINKIEVETKQDINKIKVETKQDIKKIKVECPHCKKNVLAVRFTFHLGKCMNINSRRSSRQIRNK